MAREIGILHYTRLNAYDTLDNCYSTRALQHMQSFIAQLRRSHFLRHNAILFFGSLIAGFLNYLYYPVLARLLPPTSFGEVQVLASLLAQISIFLNVLGFITVNIVANYDLAQKRNRLIVELERLALVLSVGLLVISSFEGNTLRQFFKFDSPLPFAVLAIAIAITVPLTFRASYLRGQQRFAWAAIITMVGSGIDLILAALFVKFGWGTVGVMAALVVGQSIAFVLAAALARRYGFSESLRNTLLSLPDIRLILPELKYSGLVFITSLTITALYSIDTVVIKHYFDARTAGLYAGIATIARIIFFLTASIVQVLLPAVKLHHPAAQNRLILLKSLGLMLLVGGGALAIFTLLPNDTIRILMGSTYLPYAHLLPQLSLVIFLASLLNLFIVYHLALRRYWLGPVVIIGIGLTLLLLYLNHATLIAVIHSLLGGSLGTILLLGMVSILWPKLQRLNSAKEEG